MSSAMSLQTPRQRGLQRPSYGANISPSLSASTSAAMNRKASLQALTGMADPVTPAHADSDLQVGDSVNVPGEMYGEVKFIGTVRGKAGTFVGVELDREFAARGKNSGDVDGVSYFVTNIPGAGIFLPVHRAEKRSSLSGSRLSPATPNTPTLSNLNGLRMRGNNTPPVAASAQKFAQSVGPGVRPSSPTFKPSRPSLPRPESPFRKQPPALAPTPARRLSQSQRGVRPGQTPSKTNLKSSTTGIRPPTSQTPRPYSRSGSRLGSRGEDSLLEEDRTPVGIATTSNVRTTSIGSVPSFSQPLRPSSRLGSSGDASEKELQRLRALLIERDRRLEEQAASLADMEKSVKELSAIIPQEGLLGEHEDATAAQLRQVVREKNEKISALTAEFDAHRADFRSTLDSLEMASSETERVYEEQKRDLLERIAVLEEAGTSKEDFEGVAQQLKQLEELVAELEEGLEESRRGEAEARGEVEFLRGEVERGRSELRREREKASAALKNGENGGPMSSRELEQKDDEIRGLKAIIHELSLSPGSGNTSTNGVIANASDVQRLHTELDEANRERETLERELEQLRRSSAQPNGHNSTHVRNASERTATAPDTGVPIRSRADTIKATYRRGLEDIPAIPKTQANGALFCEMCEGTDHDTLDCTRIDSEQDDGFSEANGSSAPIRNAHSPGGRGKENEEVQAAASSKLNGGEDKWCALCEEDGHQAFDCPNEQY